MTDAIAWALAEIEKRQWRCDSPAESIQVTPWSSVYRFDASQGFIYLKVMPEALFIEQRIIQTLSQKFNAPVPTIISTNQASHCFLMRDCGIKLYDYFNNNFHLEIFTDVLQIYSDLQIKTIEHVKDFINMGVPDWRMEVLPTRYEALLSEEALLLEDGLAEKEIIQLKKLTSVFSNICEKLSQYKIPNTFSHADFHDKNILIDVATCKTTIIDLGEVVITHPFFSLLNCLHRVKENFNLNAEQCQLIKNEVLQKWTLFESDKNIADIFSIIKKCWSIHAALGEHRLMNSVNPKHFQSLKREGRISKNMRHWIVENQYD